MYQYLSITILHPNLSKPHKPNTPYLNQFHYKYPFKPSKCLTTYPNILYISCNNFLTPYMNTRSAESDYAILLKNLQIYKTNSV